jgi:DNA-binding ferritin-like protein (Dps family)
MMSGFMDTIVGAPGEKKRWKHYRARVAALPGGYRTAVEAIERYLMRAGAQGHDASVQIWEDLVDLFEQAAADGTSIHDIVGDDPVGFADTFSANYGTKDWRAKERQRLLDTVARAEEEGPGGTTA